MVLRTRAPIAAALSGLRTCETTRGFGRARGGVAPAWSRGIKWETGNGATYVQYPFAVDPEMATPRGQKTSYIFPQHNAGSKFIMINRPHALNALNLDMIRDLDKLYSRVQQNPLVGLMLLYGGGDKAFCAGGDVRKLAEGGMRKRTETAPQMDFFRAEYSLNHRIANMGHATSAALLNGYCMGGGVGLSMHGEICIAGEDLMWAMPEAALGFFPDVGSSWVLPRLPHNVGRYLALTGKRLNAAEAVAAKVCTHYVPHGQVPWLFERLMSVHDYRGSDFVAATVGTYMTEEADQDIADGLSPHFAAIDKCFGGAGVTLADIRGNLSAVVGEGGESAAWAREALSLLDAGSPTSCAVTLEQMKKGAQLKNLAQCLQMEFRIARHFLSQPDFFEGTHFSCFTGINVQIVTPRLFRRRARESDRQGPKSQVAAPALPRAGRGVLPESLCGGGAEPASLHDAAPGTLRGLEKNRPCAV